MAISINLHLILYERLHNNDWSIRAWLVYQYEYRKKGCKQTDQQTIIDINAALPPDTTIYCMNTKIKVYDSLFNVFYNSCVIYKVLFLLYDHLSQPDFFKKNLTIYLQNFLSTFIYSIHPLKIYLSVSKQKLFYNR